MSAACITHYVSNPNHLIQKKDNVCLQGQIPNMITRNTVHLKNPVSDTGYPLCVQMLQLDNLFHQYIDLLDFFYF